MTPSISHPPIPHSQLVPLWWGFYYGEVAATALSQKLGAIATDPRLQRHAQAVHYADEQWHATVFADLIAQTGQPMPPPPPWAIALQARIDQCQDPIELVTGALVVEGSALFLLQLQAQAADIGPTLRRIWQQEQGHVAFGSHYLQRYLQAAPLPERQAQRQAILSLFRYMRDEIRPQFCQLHLDPVLSQLGITSQAYEQAAQQVSRTILHVLFRPTPSA